MVFWKKYWYEINDDSNGKYNKNKQIKFKTSMLRSSLSDYSEGFKRIINWNIYQPNISTEKQNISLDFLIHSRFQGANIIFVLLFENQGDRKVITAYYLQEIELKEYNVMIDEKAFLINQLK